MNAMTRMTALALASLVSLTCSGDGQSAEQKAPPPKEGASAMTLQVTSTAFKNGEPIPPRYTCTDRDISPPLAWAGAPSGTKSYALIGDDPDAPIGTWVHWVIYDLPAGGRRMIQRAEGYRHTFVSGIEVMRDGEPTGRLPGRLVRGARPAP